MGVFELISTSANMPVKVFIHSINKVIMHWHKEIEILLVLEGSINVRIGTNEYEMNDNDIILFNPNETHSIVNKSKENILLALQVQTDFYDKYFLGFSDKVFNCKSFLHEEQTKFNKIRYILSNVVWETNKKVPGYELNIISYLGLLGAYLINDFQYQQLEHGTTESISRDIFRLERIMEYIDKNIKNKITLKEVAENEKLNIYYLSHYIKRVMGISFQEYINLKRLNKAIDLLLTTDKTITEISMESGFSSTKALNTVMKRTHHCSPSEYRKEYLNGNYNRKYSINGDKEKIKSRTYLDVDRTRAFSKLYNYLDYSQENKVLDVIKFNESIKVDINKDGFENDFYWQKLTTFGRAVDGLKNVVQEQLRELQNNIGFEYIRFHGIFCDEMMICNIGENGDIIYNWSYVDQLFDFFKEVNIKPFVELGFMPSEIRASDETVFWWEGNVSGPKNIKLWTDLVKEFIKHCINRYGLEEVESWYFEVWNEPELEYIFWIGDREDYFEFYRETVLTIKSISTKLRVGGPSITHQTFKEGRWMEDFLIYCNKNNTPLDFVSLHIYPEDFSPDEDGIELIDKMGDEATKEEIMLRYQYLKRIYFEENHTYNTLKSAREKIKAILQDKVDIHVTEWSASSSDRNLISDTCFVATFIIKNIVQSIGQVDFLGYWTFTDIMEEFKLGTSHFHGGFGLINKDGLKKPSYFAYYLLSKLGREIIEQGDEYIITKDRDNIQVLAFNFAYFDELFMKGDVSALHHKKRYDVYEHKLEKQISLTLEGLNGKYKVTRYELNRENGSVFDEWIKIGAPENMTEEEIKYLKGQAQPKMTVEFVDILDDIYTENLYIPVHGAELIVLERQI